MYVVILAIKIFKALIAIVITFDFNTRQYDAINAFANPDIDEPTYCKPPDEWKEKFNVLFLFLKALYGLKQFFSL